MSTRREAFDRIGGPDAVTWPAFWITLIGGVAGHLSSAGTVSASVTVRVLVVLASQLAMFAVLLPLRVTLLRDPGRPRPWIAVGGFAVAAVVRGLVLTGLLVTIGAVDEPRWLYRIASALLNQMVLLIVVALVVSTLREHTRSLAALIGVEQDLAATQARIVEEVTGRNEDLLARVQERLRTELTALDAVQGADSVAELQRLASDVVRPMSHELARSVPAPDVPRPTHTDAHLTWQQVAAQIVDRPPMRPLATAAFIGVLLLTVALGVYGSQGFLVTIAVFLSVLMWSVIANLVLARALTRADPRTAPMLVVLTGFAIGYLSSGAGAFFLPPDSGQALFVAAGGLFIAGVVLLAALVTAVLRQQERSQRELADSTERLRRELVRLRQARWLQQTSIARALHGPVQSAVTSAALRLESAVRSGEPEAGLITDIRNELRSVVDVLDVDDLATPSLDLALARIAGTWEGVCVVRSAKSEPAQAMLEGDPIAAAVTIDVMTEAVSNAVRHGGATRAELDLSVDGDDLVILVVRNDRRPDIPESAQGGLGTNLLEECTLDWSRTTTPTDYVLTVVVPTTGSEPIDRVKRARTTHFP